MFKIDQVKNLFDCDLCSQLLVDPITFLCGNTICKRHVDEQLKHSSDERHSFRCVLCYKKHTIPEEGFVVNKRIQKALDLQFNTFQINMNMLDECKKEIEEAKEKVAKIEAFESISKSSIYGYFEDIKRKVDLRREDLKMKIDTYSEEIIQSIESTQMSLKLSKGVDQQLSTDITKLKEELDELIKSFDSLDINENKFGWIKLNVAHLNESFNRVIGDYKSSLNGDRREYTFEFMDLPIKEVFGSFAKIEKLNSTIIESESLQSQLRNLCEFPQNQKWHLKYRASSDGFKGTDFHSKCDGVENTLTVIKTTSGNVFGGFAEQAWNSNNVSVTDPNSFLFSLINKEGRAFKAICSDGGKNALGCFSQMGPVFGASKGKRDICIKTNSNTGQESYAEFGNQYKFRDYPIGKLETKTILAGTNKFLTVEIEVFTKLE